MRALAWPRIDGNPHLAAIRARFGSIAVRAGRLAAPERVMVVCFTNRSGSNFLGEMLAATGLLNVPLEGFNADELVARAERAGGLTEAVADLLGSAAPGGLALKAAPEHLEVMGELGLLEAWRPMLRFVHIERLDRLGQAISWEIARQTGRWSSNWEHVEAAEPVFERAALDAAMARFADGNRRFDLFFGTNGLMPVHVTYETLDLAPRETVARVMHAAGLPPVTVAPEQAPIRRQAGPRNAAWRQRYLNGE